MRTLFRILLDPSPAPVEGGAVPPAAALVSKSDASPEDAADLVKTRRELEEERAARKKEQIRLSELEDENRRLKTPAPKPDEKKAKSEKDSWLNGVWG